MTPRASGYAFATASAGPGTYQPQEAASASSRERGWEGGKTPTPQGRSGPPRATPAIQHRTSASELSLTYIRRIKN